MWITHCYLGTTRGDTRCLFFLLFEDYIEAQRGLPAQVNSEIERFARNLGDAGAVVTPFAGDAPAARESVLEKPWRDDQLNEVRQTPAMLMIDRDFDEFHPRHDPWVLFHFGRQFDAEVPAKIRSLFQKVAEATADPEADPFAVLREALRDDAIASASKAFRLEPGVFGVSVDLRQCWGSLKEHLRQQKALRTNAGDGGA